MGYCIRDYSTPVNGFWKPLYTISEVIPNDSEGYFPAYVVQPNQGQNWQGEEGRVTISACELTLISKDEPVVLQVGAEKSLIH